MCMRVFMYEFNCMFICLYMSVTRIKQSEFTMKCELLSDDMLRVTGVAWRSGPQLMSSVTLCIQCVRLHNISISDYRLTSPSTVPLYFSCISYCPIYLPSSQPPLSHPPSSSPTTPASSTSPLYGTNPYIWC